MIMGSTSMGLRFTVCCVNFLEISEDHSYFSSEQRGKQFVVYLDTCVLAMGLETSYLAEHYVSSIVPVKNMCVSLVRD